MLRVAVLSTAKIGRKFVLPAIAKSAHCMLMAVASRDLTRAQQLAAQYSAPYAFASYQEALQCPDVDLVYIPLPTHLHSDWAIKALAAGKHVLIEKPMALEATQVLAVAAAAKKAGRVAAEAFMVSHHPQWQWVKSLLASGELGRLYQVSGHFSYFNRKEADFRNQPAQGGGGLRDVGVYPIITARQALGCEPTLLAAHMERCPDFATDRYVDFTLDFAGVRGHFYCATQMERSQQMVFHGEHGRIVMHAPFNPMDFPQGARVDVYQQQGRQCQSRFFSDADHYLNMLDNLCLHIKGEAELTVTLADSTANQAVVDAIFRACN